MTSYWQASSLLLLTVALNIQEANFGVFCGLAAQAMIVVSLWWWSDLNGELDAAPLSRAFRAWRLPTSVAAAGGARRDLDASSFFLGYRKTKLLEDEVIESIRLPYGRPLEFVRPYKQSRRREDDIAIVTSTLRVVLAEEDGGYVVREAAFAFGGLAATVKLADATAKCMMGRRFDMDLYDTAARVLGDEVRLGASAPGGGSTAAASGRLLYVNVRAADTVMKKTATTWTTVAQRST